MQFAMQTRSSDQMFLITESRPQSHERYDYEWKASEISIPVTNFVCENQLGASSEKSCFHCSNLFCATQWWI